MPTAGKQQDSTPPTNIPQITMGDRLRRARRDAGMEAQDIAAALGVSRNTISNAENDRGLVARRTLVGWAWATGVPLGWLEHGDDYKNHEEVDVAEGRTSRRAGAGAAPRRVDNRRRTADRLLDGRHPHGRRSQLPEKFRPLCPVGESPSAA